ncbi:hypothetical protein BKA70DRAFT_1571656 [Coprinopsis sp. MPI-PUGE-AT-0042]|nr:hypothetical protein BKA70DRAFT_1571656 [Coprinopsis sp. MPI-PUGE-AT-0042]
MCTTMSTRERSRELTDDLLAALNGDFDFRGSFFHSSTEPLAPNPRLSIDGVGLIGLPLSEGDAQSIISCASQASCGTGGRKVMGAVGHTWEIEPAKITLKNARWREWLESFVSSSVRDSLGIASSMPRPRCELDKLLLFERGSSILPHRETEKAPGMFATVTVVLPTEYNGGQICLSHSGMSETLDLAKSAEMETSILAWYTGVKHEMKPITSGYRLVLSYNLIHTSPGKPRPVLPDMCGGVHRLRQVLERWREGKYPPNCFPSTSPPFFAYILERKYDENDLLHGTDRLKGADAVKVEHLLPLAQELGFVIGLANLRYTMLGSSHDDEYFANKRRRLGAPGWSSDYEASWGGDLLVDGDKAQISEEVLIPENAFDLAAPDGHGYEGQAENIDKELSQWYCRTVLILFRRQDFNAVSFGLKGGVSSAITKLRDSKRLTTGRIKILAEELLQVLQDADTEASSFTVPSCDVTEALTTLINLSLTWNNAEICNKTMLITSCSFSTVGEETLTEIVSTFPFDAIKDGLAALIKHTAKYRDRSEILTTILSELGSNRGASAWAKKQWKNALRTYKCGDVGDIPSLIARLKEVGLATLTQSLIPSMKDTSNTFAFWTGLANALHEEKEELPSSSTSVPECIAMCLEKAADQWDSPVPQSPAHKRTHSILTANDNSAIAESKLKTSRVIKVIEICLKAKTMEPCKSLLARVLGDTSVGNLPERFRDSFVPLIIKIQALLVEHNLRLASPPFGDFIKQVVEIYIDNFAVKRPSFLGSSVVPKLGCEDEGCADCKKLDTFMATSKETQCEYCAVQSTRTHIERQLASVKNRLCTFETITTRTPYTLFIKKLPTAVELAKREERVKDPKVFLSVIGKGELKAIFGTSGYQQILAAFRH